jgi:hypothetical protein
LSPASSASCLPLTQQPHPGLAAPHDAPQIRDYIAHWNTNPQPFAWTATADEILTKGPLVQTNTKKLVDNNSE